GREGPPDRADPRGVEHGLGRAGHARGDDGDGALRGARADARSRAGGAGRARWCCRPLNSRRSRPRRTGQAATMASYGECRSTEIAAAPQRCYDALADFERLPEWQGAVRSAEVLERDAQGRGTVVAYEVDAKVKRVRY